MLSSLKAAYVTGAVPGSGLPPRTHLHMPRMASLKLMYGFELRNGAHA